jgi:hypothetical protein
MTSIDQETETLPSTQWYNLVTQTMLPAGDKYGDGSLGSQQKQYTDMDSKHGYCITDVTNPRLNHESQNHATIVKDHSISEVSKQRVDYLASGDATITKTVGQSWSRHDPNSTSDCPERVENVLGRGNLPPAFGLGDMSCSTPVVSESQLPVSKTSQDTCDFSSLGSLDALTALNMATRTGLLSAKHDAVTNMSLSRDPVRDHLRRDPVRDRMNREMVSDYRPTREHI